MNKEHYTNLRKLAQSSYEDCHAGLKVLLASDPQFKAFMERKYRLRNYNETGELFLTANERFFHLIGFIDAIIHLERTHQIFWLNDPEMEEDEEEYEPENEEERLYIEKMAREGKAKHEAVEHLICSFEFGEE